MPNNVLFSLTSNKLEDDDKSRIAARLMSLPRPDKIKFGYPAFPKLSDKTELWDLLHLRLLADVRHPADVS